MPLVLAKKQDNAYLNVRQLDADLRLGVFIAHNPACAKITMNETGAAMVRMPGAANASKTGPEAAALPLQVFQNGQEVLPIQRAARFGVSIMGEEFDVKFVDGSEITLPASVTPLRDDAG